jgi:hypothetical protein
MQRRVKAKQQPLMSQFNRAIEVLVNMGKMLALKLERSVIATKDAAKDALVAAIGRILQFAHPLLQLVIRVRETSQDRSRVPGSTSDVVVPSIRVDNGKFLFIFVGDIRMRL